MTETPDPYAPPPTGPGQPTQPYPQQPYPQQPYPQQPYPQQPYGPYGAPPAPGSGLAVGALVVGIAALVTCWVPLLGLLLGVVALGLGIVAWRRASKGTGGGKAMAVIGTIFGILAILAGIVMIVLVAWFLRLTWRCYDTSYTDAQTNACIEQVFQDRFGWRIDLE